VLRSIHHPWNAGASVLAQKASEGLEALGR
jgi:hypothetical protein